MLVKLGGSILAIVIVSVLVSSGVVALWANILMVLVLIFALYTVWFRS